MRETSVRFRWIALLLALSACDDEVTRIDSRFSTPEHTVATLLRSYGLDTTPQDEIRQRILTQGSFTLRDRAAYELCFADLDQPGGEGMAGYVLGLLAAGRDDLRYEIAGDRAEASPREGVTVVFQRGEDGAFRIVLDDSVPETVRLSLIDVELNAQRERSPEP